MKLETKLKFPRSFYWGASTSSHQVEGNNKNNWSEWEEKRAKLKNLDPKIYCSRQSCDHYNLYKRDFDRLKRLNMNAFRFSIEWSRIEPEKGKINKKALEHYRDYIIELKNRDIEPFLTLWHWSVPLWVEEYGAFENKRIIRDFKNYAELIINEFGGDIKYLITINEPNVFSFVAYLAGEWPPEKNNFYSYFKVIHNLIKSHKEVYRLVKNSNPDINVGIAKNQSYNEAYKNYLHNILAKWFLDYFYNYYFLDRIDKYQDFIGINNYHHNLVKNFGKENENKVLSDFGWELYPESVYHVIRDTYERYNKPIIITENGLADAADKNRWWYIKSVLKGVSRAIHEGVDCFGYLHWSLLDNFEWAEGFRMRFGLIKVDFKTQRRTIRSSAKKFAKLVENSRFNDT